MTHKYFFLIYLFSLVSFCLGDLKSKVYDAFEQENDIQIENLVGELDGLFPPTEIWTLNEVKSQCKLLTWHPDKVEKIAALFQVNPNELYTIFDQEEDAISHIQKNALLTPIMHRFLEEISRKIEMPSQSAYQYLKDIQDQLMAAFYVHDDEKNSEQLGKLLSRKGQEFDGFEVVDGKMDFFQDLFLTIENGVKENNLIRVSLNSKGDFIQCYLHYYGQVQGAKWSSANTYFFPQLGWETSLESIFGEHMHKRFELLKKLQRSSAEPLPPTYMNLTSNIAGINRFLCLQKKQFKILLVPLKEAVLNHLSEVDSLGWLETKDDIEAAFLMIDKKTKLYLDTYENQIQYLKHAGWIPFSELRFLECLGEMLRATKISYDRLRPCPYVLVMLFLHHVMDRNSCHNGSFDQVFENFFDPYEREIIAYITPLVEKYAPFFAPYAQVAFHRSSKPDWQWNPIRVVPKRIKNRPVRIESKNPNKKSDIERINERKIRNQKIVKIYHQSNQEEMEINLYKRKFFLLPDEMQALLQCLNSRAVETLRTLFINREYIYSKEDLDHLTDQLKEGLENIGKADLAKRLKNPASHAAHGKKDSNAQVLDHFTHQNALAYWIQWGIIMPGFKIKNFLEEKMYKKYINLLKLAFPEQDIQIIELERDFLGLGSFR